MSAKYQKLNLEETLEEEDIGEKEEAGSKSLLTKFKSVISSGVDALIEMTVAAGDISGGMEYPLGIPAAVTPETLNTYSHTSTHSPPLEPSKT